MPFTPISILVIEDNPGDFVLVQTCLFNTRINVKNLLHVQTLQQGITELSLNKIDLVLLDLTLPDSISTNSFQEIERVITGIPVIILSGSKNEDQALDIVKQGAQDYLIKDELNPRILEKSILYSIERKKNLTALHQSQAQYQLLFYNNPVPMWTYDVETLKFEMVNDAAIEHYGYSREEFLNMTILDIRPDEDKQRVNEFNLAVQVNDLKHAGEWKHLKKNGEIIRVNITSHRLNFNGKKLKLIVAYDVTDKVKAIEELEKSEQVFRSLVESFPNGMITLLDAKFNILYTNGLEYKKIGLNPAECIGRKFLWQEYYKNDQNRVLSELKKCLQGETASFEITRFEKTYSSIAAPIFSEKGIEEKIVVITQDITSKYKTEQYLKLLESAIVNSSNGIMICCKPQEEGDLEIIFANRAQQAISGYSIGEIIGKSPQIFQGKETNTDTLKRIENAVLAKKNIAVELLNYKKDGTPYWVYLSIVPIFNNKQKCTHFISLSTDITDRKLAETAMQQANKALTEKNNQLYEIAMINSHIIRKPVANILGAMSLIDKSLINDSEIVELLEKIELSTLEMDKVIRDIAKKAG
ncbi:hybrid sensor histidine kinase/response regulator [Mucilaginibacter sp. KACC 22063]|uniref:hybrid sensor histidine kinase/response regulator n=1 Tax=Mucilaginibacter sp. KACC 22063 TaxID=3025666 RepID=UPI002366486A|nr:hybrid sensor histidine kinase/response regulator [Mucilaginibacter sp. KACC 22063]WDF56727.1 PAS domain S-box protein [Mucilaginibacter sp. KACC 22063]